MFEKSRIYKLALISFFAQFSIAMVNFTLVYFLRLRGFDSSEIGIAASLNPVFYVLSCIALQCFLKKRRIKLEIFLSFVLMALSLCLVILTHSRALTYLTLSLYGIANSLLWTNVETWITAGVDGNELGRTVSMFNFSWSFGAALSTFAGGFLSAMNVSLPIFVVILIFLILSVVILTVNESEYDEKKDDQNIQVDNSTMLRYFSWIALFFIYAGYSLIITIYPLYVLEELGINEERTGILLLFRGLSACFSFIILARTSFWQFNSKFLILLQLCFSLLILSLSLVENEILFALVFILFGFVFASIYEMSIFHGASGAQEREKRMMIHEVILTLGTVIGSLSGGYIYKYFSFGMIATIISATAFLVLCAEIPLLKKWKL